MLESSMRRCDEPLRSTYRLLKARKKVFHAILVVILKVLLLFGYCPLLEQYYGNICSSMVLFVYLLQSNIKLNELIESNLSLNRFCS